MLFNNKDPILERRKRLNRKNFPPVVEVPIFYSPEDLLNEYLKLQKVCSIQETYVYEDLVIGEALSLKGRISRNCTDYFPLILSEPTDIATNIQSAIDKLRGMPWVEHQKKLSAAKRVRSMMNLDYHYDPLLDERTCKKHSDLALSGYIGTLFKSLLAIPTRTRFVRLKAGDKVQTHIDNDPQYIVRIHFPITSNADCFNGFYFQGQPYEYQMKPGKAYMVNNGIPHWARNSGLSERLHLVISLDDQEDYLHRLNLCKTPKLIKINQELAYDR